MVFITFRAESSFSCNIKLPANTVFLSLITQRNQDFIKKNTMRFLDFSTKTLAILLASVAFVSAGGPTEGDAVAPDDSAVVKLTAENFESFLKETPLALIEFFAPWCGYCKQLGPEFALAADSLKESNPDIKLAQIDCTNEASLCESHDIKGYPSLKIFRGAHSNDYSGPREASGIADYMVKLSLPAVRDVTDLDDFLEAAEKESSPFVVQVFPSAALKSKAAMNETYSTLANQERDHFSFFSISNDDLIKRFNKKISADLSGDAPKYLVVHPGELDDVRVFEGDMDPEAFVEWATIAKVPDFGDINRDTYLLYMNSKVPLGYYFYQDEAQRSEVESFFKEHGKKHRGRINFVGLDASQFGRHAEVLNMDPDIVPLFAIQESSGGKKYGISQVDHPKGPSTKAISDFVDEFLSGKATPIIKSEPLPTQEEIDSQAVTKLVTHNYDEYVRDNTKDVFVKYYAPWCGHCKKLAPIWEELAEVFDPKQVVIADLDHTLNDVDTPFQIEGYPTLVFYPANGKIDPETGLREHITYSGPRELDDFVTFVRESAGTDAENATERKVKKTNLDEVLVDEEDDFVEVPKADEEDVDHDEL